MSIIFQGVSKTFITSFKRKRIPAVVNLNLEISRGEIFGIIGPNGAGKSTLLKMLMGFIKPNSGQIMLMGKSPSVPESRALVGYMPENPYFYDHLTVTELMQFSAIAAGIPQRKIRERMRELLELVELQDARKQKLRSFSKGMMQRAGLCFALVHDPQLIVLDEPMSGLDPIGRKMVVDLILSLKEKGKTVLFCSHILSDVERLCDRIGIMSHGKLKKVLDKESLVCTEERVHIYVDHLPVKIGEICKEYDLIIRDHNDIAFIDCPRDSTSTVFSLCKNEHIRILKIDNPKNPLEDIFLKTINRA